MVDAVVKGGVCRFRMEASSVVVAFADSPALRETLAVLLEPDCQLHFLRVDAVAAADCACADLALVATQRPTPVLHALRQRWPTLPTVTVAVPAHVALQPHPGVDTVPLDPHAIRRAVLERLPAFPGGALGATARRTAEALRRELAYPFAAMRSCATLHTARAGPDTDALLGAILREQTHVLDASIETLHRFRTRPRAGEYSRQFVIALCQELEQPHGVTAERGLFCTCRAETPAAHHAGPVSLAPLVAALLHAHLRRRSDSALVRVRAGSSGVRVQYTPKRAATSPSGSWPLLLASLALEPWWWSVSTAADGEQEAVSLRPQVEAA
jgi:hypothetical protein